MTKLKIGALLAISLAAFLACAWRSTAEAPPAPKAGLTQQLRVTRQRFEFEVVESFDAKYLGDTPGHVGRNGGLGEIRPRAALGDPVFRERQKVGTISKLVWDRTRGSLEVEFNPDPLHTTNVGDLVWIAIDGSGGKMEGE